MRKTTELHFSKVTSRQGEVGVEFTGRQYGETRLRHKFFSLAQIREMLQDGSHCPNGAAKWNTLRRTKEGNLVPDGCSLTTAEFRRALVAHEEKALGVKISDPLMAHSRPMMFQYMGGDHNSGERVAYFGNGIESRTLNFDDIRARVEIDPNVPAPSDQHLFPKHELIRAYNHFKGVVALPHIPSKG